MPPLFCFLFSLVATSLAISITIPNDAAVAQTSATFMDGSRAKAHSLLFSRKHETLFILSGNEVSSVSADCRQSVLWFRELPWPAVSMTLSSSEEVLFAAFGESGGLVLAFNASTGATVWRRPWFPPDPSKLIQGFPALLSRDGYRSPLTGRRYGYRPYDGSGASAASDALRLVTNTADDDAVGELALRIRKDSDEELGARIFSVLQQQAQLSQALRQQATSFTSFDSLAAPLDSLGTTPSSPSPSASMTDADMVDARLNFQRLDKKLGKLKKEAASFEREKGLDQRAADAATISGAVSGEAAASYSMLLLGKDKLFKAVSSWSSVVASGAVTSGLTFVDALAPTAAGEYQGDLLLFAAREAPSAAGSARSHVIALRITLDSDTSDFLPQVAWSCWVPGLVNHRAAADIPGQQAFIITDAGSLFALSLRRQQANRHLCATSGSGPGLSGVLCSSCADWTTDIDGAVLSAPVVSSVASTSLQSALAFKLGRLAEADVSQGILLSSGELAAESRSSSSLDKVYHNLLMVATARSDNSSSPGCVHTCDLTSTSPEKTCKCVFSYHKLPVAPFVNPLIDGSTVSTTSFEETPAPIAGQSTVVVAASAFQPSFSFAPLVSSFATSPVVSLYFPSAAEILAEGAVFPASGAPSGIVLSQDLQNAKGFSPAAAERVDQLQKVFASFVRPYRLLLTLGTLGGEVVCVDVTDAVFDGASAASSSSSSVSRSAVPAPANNWTAPQVAGAASTVAVTAIDGGALLPADVAWPVLLVWSRTVHPLGSRAIVSGPVSDGNVTVVASVGGQIAALDARSGEVHWRRTVTRSPVQSSAPPLALAPGAMVVVPGIVDELSASLSAPSERHASDSGNGLRGNSKAANLATVYALSGGWPGLSSLDADSAFLITVGEDGQCPPTIGERIYVAILAACIVVTAAGVVFGAGMSVKKWADAGSEGARKIVAAFVWLWRRIAPALTCGFCCAGLGRRLQMAVWRPRSASESDRKDNTASPLMGAKAVLRTPLGGSGEAMAEEDGPGGVGLAPAPSIGPQSPSQAKQKRSGEVIGPALSGARPPGLRRRGRVAGAPSPLALEAQEAGASAVPKPAAFILARAAPLSAPARVVSMTRTPDGLAEGEGVRERGPLIPIDGRS